MTGSGSDGGVGDECGSAHGDERTRVNEPDHDHHHDPRHFDEMAATWDDEAKIARAQMIAERITAAVRPTTATRVFEYGAGTGLVTEAFGDHIGPALLADSSEGMRNVMASKIANGLLLDAQISDVDLGDPDAELPEERFDLIITVLTLHHIVEIERVLTRFHELLLEDGHLCIVDLDAEDGSFHGEGFVGHHGFDRGELSATLHSSGFDPVEMLDCGSLTRDDGDYPMFLAVASRSETPGGNP